LSGSRPDARRRSRTPRLAAPPRRDPAALRARRARCFFSSRRRHTRSKRDWSSDVCSSDLPTTPHAANEEKDAAVLRGTAPDLPGRIGVCEHVTRTPRRPDVQSLTYPVRAAVSARLFTVGVEGPHGLRGVRRDSVVHDGADDPCVQDLAIAPPAGALDLPCRRLIPL